MKHVLVVYAHNFSAWFLGDQNLRGAFAPNYDSCDFITDGMRERRESHATESTDDEDGMTAREYLDGMLTENGDIQFHHFKHKLPSAIASGDKNDFRSWVKILQDSLPDGESLDAIVLTKSYEGHESSENIKLWLQELKKDFPQIKVMSTCSAPSLGSIIDIDASESNDTHAALRQMLSLPPLENISTSISK